jgi:hypothetical protein
MIHDCRIKLRPLLLLILDWTCYSAIGVTKGTRGSRVLPVPGGIQGTKGKGGFQVPRGSRDPEGAWVIQEHQVCWVAFL